MRWIRWPLASMTLVWLAASSWSHQIDDVYISARYAQEWAESGSIRWSESERGEGYSNFSWVCLMAIAENLGMDLGLWSQILSLACGVAILALFDRLLPRNRGGHLLLAAITLWPPTAYWSAMGMETQFFTLLAIGSLALCLRGHYAAGCWLAALSALTRPEGLVWWCLCIATRRGSIKAGCASGLPLLLYHGWRLSTFESILPTSVSQKLHFGILSIPELGAGVLVTSAIGFIAWHSYRIPREAIAWITAPLLLSAALIIAIGGDWMAHGRLLLPGVLGALVALACLAEPRALTRRQLAIGIALTLTLGSLDTPFLRPPTLRMPSAAPWQDYAGGLDTPLHQQVKWLIENSPNGSVVQAADVGMINQIPGIEILDVRGLTCAQCNRSRRSGDWSWLEARYASQDRPRIIQVMRLLPPGWPETPPLEIDEWLQELLPVVKSNYPIQSEFATHYSGFSGTTRFYRFDDQVPEPAEVERRWAILAERYPSQPFFRARGVR